MKDLNLSVLGYFFDGLMRYFAEPIGRIFGPDDDDYPAVGVQSFDGEICGKIVETL